MFFFTEIKNKFQNCNNSNDCDDFSVDVTRFLEVFNNEYLSECVLHKSIKIYISGYGSHSVFKQLNCSICKVLIVEGKGNTVGNIYFHHVQRAYLFPLKMVQPYSFICVR